MPTATKDHCKNCDEKRKKKALENGSECACDGDCGPECDCECHDDSHGARPKKGARNCDDKSKKMKNRRDGALLLLNRDFTLPEDGWFHIVAKGEFPHKRTGFMQIIDDEACELIVNRFKAEASDENFPGILVDYDHFSLDDKQPSEAAGWIEDMENRDSGVWARIRWSDTGEQAVKGGRYRLVSPVWTLEDCQKLENKHVRPLRIDSVALTNDPNLKGLTPLSNRCAEIGSADPQTEEPMNTKLLLTTLLGLAAEATDSEIEGAVGLANRRLQDSEKTTKRVPAIAAALGLKEDATDEAIVNRATSLVADNAKFQTEQAKWLDAQVERDLEEYKEVIGNKEAVKKGLLANRDSMIEVLKALKKPAGSKTPLHNRETAKSPTDNFDKSGGEDASTEAQRARAAKISNRASDLMNQPGNKAKKMSFAAAWRMAEHEMERAEIASK